jgi:hypothetical protein
MRQHYLVNHHGIYIVNDLENYSLCNVPRLQSKREYYDPENEFFSEYINEGVTPKTLVELF